MSAIRRSWLIRMEANSRSVMSATAMARCVELAKALLWRVGARTGHDARWRHDSGRRDEVAVEALLKTGSRMFEDARGTRRFEAVEREARAWMCLALSVPRNIPSAATSKLTRSYHFPQDHLPITRCRRLDNGVPTTKDMVASSAGWDSP